MKLLLSLLALTFSISLAAKENASENIKDPRDGKTYKTVKIGEQIWMAENLNYEASGKCYDNKPANCEKYGRLYDWNTAKTAFPLCLVAGAVPMAVSAVSEITATG